jgi:uncharacterized protein (TIGR02246 family)
MDATDATHWVERYRTAWESNEQQAIAALFTEDALYFTAPFRDPWRGREGIVSGWLEAKDEPGDTEFSYEVVAVCDATAFVRGWTKYFTEPAREYSNLWVIRLAEDGRAREFTEWWMEH